MRLARAAPLALLAFGATSGCDTIESRRRSTAPLNASGDFPCDRYVGGDRSVSAVPREGRCLFENPVLYDLSIVVHVPESSLYAPGHTFVVTSSTDPRLNDLEVGGTGGERLAKLPVVGTMTGAYTVKSSVSARVLGGDRLADGTSLPVRAVYIPLGRENRPDYDPALPLDVVFASSRVDENQSPRLAYVRSLPAGRWLRAFEPESPWEDRFPPFLGSVVVRRPGQLDGVDIGGANGDFDDLGGTSRDARVTRAEGLEDWTVFLRDKASGQRISTLKTLCHGNDPADCSVERDEANTRLETVGRGTLIDEAGPVEGVLAPPPGWIATPSLVFELTNGCCLVFRYPELRPPLSLEGIVAASAEGGGFVGVASRVTLESESITLPDGKAETRLRYATTVSTDDRGRFESVVPSGTYRVTVHPLEGTGFASFRMDKVIEDDDPADDPIHRTRITLLPPRRTRVRGSAMLTDGRPAANAEVLAVAQPVVGTTAQLAPRPGRTTVGADGTFALDLDQGAYVLTVVPEPGTGFPRVVTRTTIPPDRADVGVIRIPPPTRLGLQIVEPSTLARAIPFANVRIFASPERGGSLLEIGSGMTNAEGRVEILLAQQPQ